MSGASVEVWKGRCRGARASGRKCGDAALRRAGTGKLESLGGCTADVVGLDWAVDLPEARRALGGRVTQGNVDPMVLFGGEGAIRQASRTACCTPHDCFDITWHKWTVFMGRSSIPGGPVW